MAGGRTFLLPPATIGPDVAGGKRRSNRRQQADNTLDQGTVFLLEVRTALAQAGRRKAKHFRRGHRPGKVQHVRGNGQGSDEVRDTRFVGRSPDHADQDTARPVWLRAGTEGSCFYIGLIQHSKVAPHDGTYDGPQLCRGMGAEAG